MHVNEKIVKRSNYKENSCRDKEIYGKVTKTEPGINSLLNEWSDDSSGVL